MLKADEDGGGTAFADYVWKPVVPIEMKRRGTDLQKHCRQAFDCGTRLVPNRPRYVGLCNFDEFRSCDFGSDLDTPKNTVALKYLPERWGRGRCLRPVRPNPHWLWFITKWGKLKSDLRYRAEFVSDTFP